MAERPDVRANVRAVLAAMAAAARGAGRDPSDVRLVAVAKGKPAPLVRAAIEAGVRIVGENYVQEAEKKRPLVGLPAQWHFVGRLQRNKAGKAAALFDVIESADRLDLLRTLDRIGRCRERPVPVLLEVNVAREPTKAGFLPEELPAAVEEAANLGGIRLEGLMTIGPLGASEEEKRRVFRRLRELRDDLCRLAPLPELSMGMSDDFALAVAEGATLVRIGRAIFGPREKDPEEGGSTPCPRPGTECPASES
ncbi:MAG: YggS family pyridoxal phosphate enzyme [Candidatus Binatia bacterium]|nr:MAG: YggS family pyridoxal phosphate enzyme [Candidatus Binatia bacterium]